MCSLQKLAENCVETVLISFIHIFLAGYCYFFTLLRIKKYRLLVLLLSLILFIIKSVKLKIMYINVVAVVVVVLGFTMLLTSSH